uniref:PDZ domain-containing protein n=1 Tax=Pavo cristatus TaxID=9049 RepID=A0A8C9G150_PAVCR
KENANLKLLPLKPRLIELQKGKSGYGFYLRMEQNSGDHVIKDVDSKSPAAKAGLKDDDILVAVNGERVDALDHESVVGKIKQSEEKTTLLVVDKETDAMYKLVMPVPTLNIVTKKQSAYFFYSQLPFPSCFVEMTSVLQARECKVTKKPKKSYGFFLRVEKDTAGHLIRNVEKNSPAEKAGLKDGDRVLRVNGVFVDKEEHAKVQTCLVWGLHHLPLSRPTVTTGSFLLHCYGIFSWELGEEGTQNALANRGEVRSSKMVSDPSPVNFCTTYGFLRTVGQEKKSQKKKKRKSHQSTGFRLPKPLPQLMLEYQIYPQTAA